MKQKVLIGIGVFAGVLLAIYIGFVIFFSSHYLWNTTINSIKCGGKTSDYVIQKCSSIADDYLLTIIDRNENKFNIKGPDISYKYVPLGEEEKFLKEQNPFTWPISIFKPAHYELSTSVSFDEKQYQSDFESLGIFAEDYIQKPEDSYIKINTDDFEIVPEVMGNTPVNDKIYELVTDALYNEKSELTLTDDCYVAPQILSDNPVITNAADKIKAYMNSTIHYDIDNADENFTAQMILKMIKINDDGEVSLDTSVVTDFVQHLASTYNTYADVREFATSKGDTIKIGGGDYGWVINKKAEEAQILSDLEGGTPVTREPVYEQRAIQSGLDDIGNTYIEIDYTNQHLWYYKDGELALETDIVSGNISRQNGSVDGVYKIVYKQRNATLIGEGYESKVNYFMPFAYNIGIHDAGWRDSFGKTIYKTSGSHGCINVPPKKAKELYEIVENGTPVIAYYREKVELTNNAAKVSNAYSYVEKDDKDSKKKN